MFSRLTPVVKNLLIINVAVFVIFNFLFKIDDFDWFGLRYILAPEFQPHQLITHMFIHADGRHLFGNMFALFIFGPMLEQFMGPKRFLYFYLICGFGASLLFSVVNAVEINQMQAAYEAYIANPNPSAFNHYIKDFGGQYFNQVRSFIGQFGDSPDNLNLIAQSKGYAQDIFELKLNRPLGGASGAVFGILMGFAMLFPNTELFLLFIPFPIKAKYLVGAYGLYELYAGIQRAQGDNVAHFAHLGGMLIAFLLIRYWRKNSRNFY